MSLAKEMRCKNIWRTPAVSGMGLPLRMRPRDGVGQDRWDSWVGSVQCEVEISMSLMRIEVEKMRCEKEMEHSRRQRDGSATVDAST